MTTFELITSGQEKQIIRFGSDSVEAALKTLGLDKVGAQRVIEHGDEFTATVRNAVQVALQSLSVTDQFADEEVESEYGYLSGYEPKPIVEQVARLRELFPELSSVDESVAEQPLPQHAEGWFAIPRWEKVADTYGNALAKVFGVLSSARDGEFYNYREGKMGSQHLRQHERTVAMLKRISEQQGNNDILIAPAQFGLRHRGRSVRRAREVMSASEFCLGAFQIAVMLLTHPERLQHYDDLWIDCAGDEYDAAAGGSWSSAPYFYFYDRVGFSSYWLDFPNYSCGSPSGFVPQS